TAVHESIRPATGGGVAFVVFSTESPHASRGDVHVADMARTLRRAGVPSRVFHVHLDPRDSEENRRRVGRLVGRVVDGCWRWVASRELWMPEMGEQLLAAGIGIIETRSHTFPGAIFAEGVDLLQHVRECSTGQPVDELTDLIEIVGPRNPRPI